jgi:hypothetical protein
LRRETAVCREASILRQRNRPKGSGTAKHSALLNAMLCAVHAGACNHPYWSGMTCAVRSAPVSESSDVVSVPRGSTKSTEWDWILVGGSRRAGGRKPSGEGLLEQFVVDTVDPTRIDIPSDLESVLLTCSSCGIVGTILFEDDGSPFSSGSGLPEQSAADASSQVDPPSLGSPFLGGDDGGVGLGEGGGVDSVSTLSDSPSVDIVTSSSSNLRPRRVRFATEEFVSPPGAKTKRRRCTDCEVVFTCGRRSRSLLCESCRHTALQLMSQSQSVGMVRGVQVASPGSAPCHSSDARLPYRVERR